MTFDLIDSVFSGKHPVWLGCQYFWAWLGMAESLNFDFAIEKLYCLVVVLELRIQSKRWKICCRDNGRGDLPLWQITLAARHHLRVWWGNFKEEENKINIFNQNNCRFNLTKNLNKMPTRVSHRQIMNDVWVFLCVTWNRMKCVKNQKSLFLSFCHDK